MPFHLYRPFTPIPLPDRTWPTRVTTKSPRWCSVDTAVRAAQLCKKLGPTVPGTDIRWQYSPESFPGTELEFAKEICEGVMDVWEPTAKRPVILTLPATVEMATPNVYADQIEW